MRYVWHLAMISTGHHPSQYIRPLAPGRPASRGLCRFWSLFPPPSEDPREGV